MPANRSRTENWKDCLRRINERNGALEIAIDRASGIPGAPRQTKDGSDLVWRVRVLEVRDDVAFVEAPGALGRHVPVHSGTPLIAAMSIGQNRWMFHSRALNTVGTDPAEKPGPAVLIIELPDEVERCTRRNNYRISTADLNLPRVQCWPLLDPLSAVAAEAVNRVQLTALLRSGTRPSDNEPLLLPHVGPEFNAALLNIGAGGLGLRVEREFNGAVGSRPHLWLRVNLTPQIPAPIAVTVRVAHTHADSTQALYVGLAFEFAFNPEHRAFILDLFRQYADRLQGDTLSLRAA